MWQRRIALGVVVLLVAAGLRVVGLSDYPPGPHYDEAANLIIARTVAFGGARPFPMVENYQGREVLYYYLAAPLLHTVHNSRFALQLLGVYANVLMVAFTMALTWRMFPRGRGWLVGVLAGIVAAVSLPQVLLARQAFRAITLPMMQALTLALLWRGLSARRGTGWLIVAGIMGGATVYTYNSSRLFPIWLALAGLVLLVGSPATDRLRRLRQGAWFFGPMIAVGLPFAHYAVQSPDVFFGRLYEVTGSADAVTLPESVWLHAKMFFVHGETLLRYNPTGRPYFTPLEGATLMLGLLWALWRAIRERDALTRAGWALLLMSPLMVIPSVIATGGLPPNHMRSVGMVPLVFIVVAVGFERVLRPVRRDSLVIGFALLLLGAGAYHTGDVYARWASRADLYYDTDADLAAAALWLSDADNVPADTPVYVAARDRYHPTVTVFDTPPVRWLGTDTFFIPPAGERLAVFPRSAPVPDEWADWLAPYRVAPESLPQAPDNRAAFDAYRLNADMPLPESLAPYPAGPRTPNLALMSRWSGGAFPNGPVTVANAWAVLTPPSDEDLTPLVHITDTLGHVIMRGESFSVGTHQWESDETLLQRVPDMRVPVGTPAGDYDVMWAWVARGRDAYQPYTLDDELAGVWTHAGTLEVLRPMQFPPADDVPRDVPASVDVADGVRLIGWNYLPEQVRPGETFSLTLHWQSVPHTRRADMRYTIHAGDTPLELDAPLLDAQPTSTWIDGQLMTERLHVTLPRTLANGDYPLTLHADDVPPVSLATLTIDGAPRLFDPPTVDTTPHMPLGDSLRLYGYSIDRDTSQLTLVWQADAVTTTDYTVFVHGLDATGAIVTQYDRYPQVDYPTSLWLDGEYVVDVYTLDAAPNVTDVRVGMYDATTGTRLIFADGASTHDIVWRR